MHLSSKNNNKKGVVILAAGISKRMDSLKPFLQFNKNTNFIEKIIATYSQWGCDKIIVVINQEAKEQFLKLKGINKLTEFVVNNHLEHERFYSVKIGLEKMKYFNYCFIQNTDNPFTNRDILDKIYQEKSEHFYISPSYKGRGGHPILINKKIIEQITSISQNDLNLRDVLSNIPSKKIEINSDIILVNINTPEEYANFIASKIN